MPERRTAKCLAILKTRQITLKVLRFEERDKRLVIKDAQMVA